MSELEFDSFTDDSDMSIGSILKPDKMGSNSILDKYAQQHNNLDIIIELLNKKIKTQQEVQILANETRNIQFFRDYIEKQNEPDVHIHCCYKMKYEYVPKGRKIFNIGDQGDKFYIILQGCVGIYIQSFSRKQSQIVLNTINDLSQQQRKSQMFCQRESIKKKQSIQIKLVKQLFKDEAFGELALINNKARSASTIAHTDCHFAVLDRASFQKILLRKERQKLQKAIDFFGKSHELSLLTPSQLHYMYHNSYSIQLRKNDFVFSQNDLVDKVFVVRKGDFRIYLEYDLDDEQEQIQQIQHFLDKQNQVQKKQTNQNNAGQQQQKQQKQQQQEDSNQNSHRLKPNNKQKNNKGNQQQLNKQNSGQMSEEAIIQQQQNLLNLIFSKQDQKVPFKKSKRRNKLIEIGKLNEGNFFGYDELMIKVENGGNELNQQGNKQQKKCKQNNMQQQQNQQQSNSRKRLFSVRCVSSQGEIIWFAKEKFVFQLVLENYRMRKFLEEQAIYNLNGMYNKFLKFLKDQKQYKQYLFQLKGQKQDNIEAILEQLNMEEDSLEKEKDIVFRIGEKGDNSARIVMSNQDVKNLIQKQIDDKQINNSKERQQNQVQNKDNKIVNKLKEKNCNQIQRQQLQLKQKKEWDHPYTQELKSQLKKKFKEQFQIDYPGQVQQDVLTSAPSNTQRLCSQSSENNIGSPLLQNKKQQIQEEQCKQQQQQNSISSIFGSQNRKDILKNKIKSILNQQQQSNTRYGGFLSTKNINNLTLNNNLNNNSSSSAKWQFNTNTTTTLNSTHKQQQGYLGDSFYINKQRNFSESSILKSDTSLIVKQFSKDVMNSVKKQYNNNNNNSKEELQSNSHSSQDKRKSLKEIKQQNLLGGQFQQQQQLQLTAQKQKVVNTSLESGYNSYNALSRTQISSSQNLINIEQQQYSGSKSQKSIPHTNTSLFYSTMYHKQNSGQSINYLQPQQIYQDDNSNSESKKSPHHNNSFMIRKHRSQQYLYNSNIQQNNEQQQQKEVSEFEVFQKHKKIQEIQKEKQYLKESQEKQQKNSSVMQMKNREKQRVSEYFKNHIFKEQYRKELIQQQQKDKEYRKCNVKSIQNLKLTRTQILQKQQNWNRYYY